MIGFSYLEYIAGKTMGDLMNAEQKATLDTLRNNNFSYREIFIPEINVLPVCKSALSGKIVITSSINSKRCSLNTFIKLGILIKYIYYYLNYY